MAGMGGGSKGGTGGPVLNNWEETWSAGPGNAGEDSAILDALMEAQDDVAGGTADVNDLKVALEGLERRKRVAEVSTLPAALNELSYLNAYVDELHNKLRKAVREIERASARSIKAKIRVKRVEHLMKEELAVKKAQAAADLFEVEESKEMVLSEAKAVIKHLSNPLGRTAE